MQNMSRFKIANPGTVAGEFSRALLAKMWNLDLEHGPGVAAYRIDASDVEALLFHLGQETAESAMRGADFHPMIPGYWKTRYRTEKGGNKVVRLFPPYDLLGAIKRTYGREDHSLAVIMQVTTSLRFVESGSEQSACRL